MKGKILLISIEKCLSKFEDLLRSWPFEKEKSEPSGFIISLEGLHEIAREEKRSLS